MATLADAEVHYVLVGEVAGAAHGWPITLARGEYLVVAEEGTRNLERLAAAAQVLGGGPRELEDPFAGRDVTVRWPLAGGSLAAATHLSGTRGYRDLQRASRPVALEQAVVQVAALRDLIRIADASPLPERRMFLPALWATLEQAERRGIAAQTPAQTQPSSGPLDLTFRPDGTAGYEDLVKQATHEQVPGSDMKVLVAAGADIIRSKAAAGRAKDLAVLPQLREDFAR